VGRRAAPRRRPAADRVVVRRRVLAVAVVLLVVYIGYLAWFRNLSWFEIHDVSVEGATTSQQQIKTAIVDASQDMTTLHIKDDELVAAVSRFPTVASVKADTSFPHGLHVTVTERLPVADAVIAGQRVAVSADGYLLTGLSFDPKDLPRLSGASASGPRLTEQSAAQAAILGAAPRELRDRLSESSWEDESGGVVVDVDGGPELRFGDGSRPADKWKAAVAVLSGPERGSPSYLDVSVPDRPVSGG
jgi:cell division protein FtsQ